METLKNGAKVLAQTIDINKGQAIVLATWQRGGDGGEYVTWLVNLADGEAYWGHYHGSDIIAATHDYVERSS